jgi:hypothetical protein
MLAAGDDIDDPARRRGALERLAERDAERVLIGARTRRLAGPLLGRHVARGAEDAAGLGGARPTGEAEVTDAYPAIVADEDVVGLEVAVDDAELVGRRQAARGLDVRRDDLGPRRHAFVAPPPQGRARDQLHREVELAVVLADVVDAHDVGMRERGHRSRLARQPRLLGGVIADLATVAQELDREPASELGVLGGEHDAHAALAEHLEQAVAADRVAGPAAGVTGQERDGLATQVAGVEVSLELAVAGAAGPSLDQRGERLFVGTAGLSRRHRRSPRAGGGC